MSTAHYPRSFDEMIAAKNMIFPPETFERGEAFRPKADDVSDSSELG